jgi:hypothetical protein
MMGDGARRSTDRPPGERPRLTDVATCPYCGEDITLGACKIVATELVGSTAGGDVAIQDVQDADSDGLAGAGMGRGLSTAKPRSGSEVLEWRGPNGDWPVIHEAPLTIFKAVPRGRLARLTEGVPELPSADELGPIEDLPARLCPCCETPLPVDIDDRELLTIAVVGVVGATKTHFLGSMLHAAYHEQALQIPLGCTEFAPDEVTAKRFHEDYYLSLFVDGQEVLSATQEEPNARFKPLAFRVTLGDGVRRTLLFHDIAGEVFTDKAKRNLIAPFVRRADGIIFLLDPQWMPRVAKYLREHFNFPSMPPPYNQAALVNAVAEEVGRARELSTVPAAVVLSKSDLLAGALGEQFLFDQDPPDDREGWMRSMRDVNDEVESLLGNELRSPDLVAAIHQLGNATFHAVAPLGVQPTGGILTPDSIHPRRCLDPLVSVLSGIDGVEI